MVPLSADDLRYIDELIVRINAMIAGQAAANDAEFVDTYRDSGGHDVCKLPPNRWFEGLVPTEPAYPLHPNAKGEASMARSAIAQLKKPRPGGHDPAGWIVGLPRPQAGGRRARNRTHPARRHAAGARAPGGCAGAPDARRVQLLHEARLRPGDRRVLEARPRGARPQHRAVRRIPARVSRAPARRVRPLPRLATQLATARHPWRARALRGGCGPRTPAKSAQAGARPPRRCALSPSQIFYEFVGTRRHTGDRWRARGVSSSERGWAPLPSWRSAPRSGTTCSDPLAPPHAARAAATARAARPTSSGCGSRRAFARA